MAEKKCVAEVISSDEDSMPTPEKKTEDSGNVNIQKGIF
jgi:hypothetical protein